jgi:predicted small lipoprotein YifL
MLRADPEPVVNRYLRHIFLLAGLLAMPLVLSGCGVKGPLMPPQASAAADSGVDLDEEDQPGRISPSPSAQTPGSPRSSGNPMFGNAGSPAVANAPNATKRSPLDWLLN